MRNANRYQSQMQTPTPLRKHEILSKELDCHVYIKHEDLIDGIGSGHKLRKLEYIIRDALAQGIDTLVTYGSPPSNQCKTLAHLANMHGMECHLILGGDKQVKPLRVTGTYRITQDVSDNIHWHESTPWRLLKAKAEALAVALSCQGKKVRLVESGASKGAGLHGSIDLGREIVAQGGDLGIAFSHQVVCAGSGGTAIGLAIANEAAPNPITVHGICIGSPAKEVEDSVESILASISAPSLKNLQRILFHDCAKGLAYDTPTSEEKSLQKEAIKKYGLLLDLNYMTKTLNGLIKLVKQGAIARNSHVVLLHSGGSLGYFDDSY